MNKAYQKALKIVTLFSLSNPVPFNTQNYQKQKRPLKEIKYIKRTLDILLGRQWLKTPKDNEESSTETKKIRKSSRNKSKNTETKEEQSINNNKEQEQKQ